MGNLPVVIEFLLLSLPGRVSASCYYNFLGIHGAFNPSHFHGASGSDYTLLGNP